MHTEPLWIILIWPCSKHHSQSTVSHVTRFDNCVNIKTHVFFSFLVSCSFCLFRMTGQFSFLITSVTSDFNLTPHAQTERKWLVLPGKICLMLYSGGYKLFSSSCTAYEVGKTFSSNAMPSYHGLMYSFWWRSLRNRRERFDELDTQLQPMEFSQTFWTVLIPGPLFMFCHTTARTRRYHVVHLNITVHIRTPFRPQTRLQAV